MWREIKGLINAQLIGNGHYITFFVLSLLSKLQFFCAFDNSYPINLYTIQEWLILASFKSDGLSISNKCTKYCAFLYGSFSYKKKELKRTIYAHDTAVFRPLTLYLPLVKNNHALVVEKLDTICNSFKVVSKFALIN